MAHKAQLEFIRQVVAHYRHLLCGGSVLEVGSYDVNGSVRSILLSQAQVRSYVGADLVAGPGVDIVCSGDRLGFDAEKFDATISCECFEHNEHWQETFQNMIRMTKPGGLVVITCATHGRLEHGTRRTTPGSSPGTQHVGSDYYRNLRQEDFDALGIPEQFQDHFFAVNRPSADLYFLGIKKGARVNRITDDFRKDVRLIRNLRSDAPLAQRILIDVPLSLMARIIPDAKFSDTGLAYLRALKKVRKLVSRSR